MPPDVTQCLKQGGLPHRFCAAQLEWLAARHYDLATHRGGPHDKYDMWRLRWAYTCRDIIETINNPMRLKP